MTRTRADIFVRNILLHDKMQLRGE